MGQTEEMVEALKQEDASKAYDEEYDQNQTRHQIMSTIKTRTLNPEVLTQDKINSYIDKLKSMVKGYDFAGHVILEHGVSCPAENVDIFQLETSQRYADLQNRLMEQYDFSGYEEEEEEDTGHEEL